MFSLRRPNEHKITRFIARQAGLDFSYPEVGATRHAPPSRYYEDHVRMELGRGEAAFAAAKAAMLRWEQFRTNWTTIFWPQTPVEPGQTVAVLARVPGLWSLNACRIIYVVDEHGPVNRFGFGYGTLPGHLESGEERFLIEWDRASGAVSYDILAFFRPNHLLARIGWFYALRKVNQFRRDSAEAMRAATRPPKH
jgi:uncharacterized protein (UPF0548 family)